MVRKVQKYINRLKMVANDHRWWWFYFQRRFMKPTARAWWAAFVARNCRPLSSHFAQGPNEENEAWDLKLKGIAVLGELLTPAACEELRAYFNTCRVHDPYRQGTGEFFPLDHTKRHPDAHIAHHTASDVLAAPHLIELANHPRILALVSHFLGCKPTLSYMAAWWSYHTEKGAQQAEFFHRDVDDWKFVKLFVYLTDVGPDSGPHVYVQNSSSSDKLVKIGRFQDAEVREAFGSENILTMTAKAGEGFLEDTFGIHKGQPVANGTRLIFQAVYGLTALPYGPKWPVMTHAALGRPGLDPWINRVYIK